jgi:hypothetical protein
MPIYLSDSGSVNTIDRADAAIRATGVNAARLVMWTWGSLDGNPCSASTITNSGIHHAKDGAVFVLHDGSANYRNLAVATDRIVSTLHSRGYCFGVLNQDGDIVPLAAGDAAYTVPERVVVDENVWINYLLRRTR